MNDKEQLPLVPAEWEAEKGGKAISVDKAKEDFDIGYPHIKAEELKGESFVIVGAREFESVQFPDSPAFFCLCRDDGSGELYTTVLGGRQPVEFLSAYLAKGGKQPLAVTLTFKEGGAHGGYYVIE